MQSEPAPTASGAPSAAPAAEKGPEIGITAFVATVYKEPRDTAKKLGYLRAGAIVPRSAEPAGKAGCPGGWYEIKPRGFVCAGDTLGLGVLHACAERGLRPGEDIGVVGFDDSLAAQVTWPGLSSVRQPLEQVAVDLVRILHTVLAHKPLTDRGRMLQPTLVVRRSSQRSN